MNHLDYYRAHNIAPVQYSGTKEQHFQRRASLYRALRLPPLAFRGARVLEVAAGTGQNAEYVASLKPAHLELVEPNPINWQASGLRVEFVPLERYQPAQLCDIAICENWLGLPEVDAGLLKKLASFVAPDGVLVLTCVHPLGYYPNALRRKIAARLITDEMSFESKTQILVSAFETHLATMKDMTRSAKDWVQDMLLNPAVEHFMLTFPMLLEHLGAEFTILGTSPEFITDWRWFKSLHGDARRFNAHALQHYVGQEANFLSSVPDAYISGALDEAEELLARDVISVGDVRAMRSFRSLFGRETIFCSFQRT